jgi:hypothetical protein
VSAIRTIERVERDVYLFLALETTYGTQHRHLQLAEVARPTVLQSLKNITESKRLIPVQHHWRLARF